MVRFSTKILPWIIVLLPFALVGLFYSSLADEILIAKNLDGSDAIFARRSPFTAFRVPLIELVCAFAIQVARRPGERNPELPNYFLMWTVLLYTAGLKSLVQALEIVSDGLNSPAFFYLTVIVVGSGIILAMIPGWKAWSEVRRKKPQFLLWESLALITLLLAYISLALVPLYLYESSN